MSGIRTEGGEPEVELVLRDGLSVSPLSAEALSRIRTAAEAEWRANVGRRPGRWLPYAAAASLLALTLTGVSWFSGAGRADHGEPAARLVQFEAPGVLEVHTLRRDTSLTDGTVLRSGRTYRANGQALLDLEDSGNLRVASDSEFAIVARDVVRLNRGEIYVDIPPGTHTRAAFIVRTAAGEFRHVGTQFALAIIHGQTRLRVREGSVQWLAADGESTVQAGTEVVFSNGTKSVERPIDSSGTEWDWTATTTPDFEIDNRPLAEFLEWVARESGRKLILADDLARKKAESIRMHGSVHGLAPMQALSAVMAATELRYDLPAGQVRVSFEGEGSSDRTR